MPCRTTMPPTTTYQPLWEGQWGGGGGGSRRGFRGRGSRRVGLGGGSRWGNLGGTCPQGQVLVNHKLPLPPLALPLTRIKYWDRAGAGRNTVYFNDKIGTQWNECGSKGAQNEP